MNATPTTHLVHTGLSKREAEALINIRNGVDVYSIGLAGVLRLMQRRGLPVNDFKSNPGQAPHADALFDITQPKNYTGDGRDQMPYFGAIATPRGIQAARRVIAKRRSARSQAHPTKLAEGV